MRCSLVARVDATSLATSLAYSCTVNWSPVLIPLCSLARCACCAYPCATDTLVSLLGSGCSPRMPPRSDAVSCARGTAAEGGFLPCSPESDAVSCARGKPSGAACCPGRQGAGRGDGAGRAAERGRGEDTALRHQRTGQRAELSPSATGTRVGLESGSGSAGGRTGRA